MPTRVPKLGLQLTTLGEPATENSPFTSASVPHKESGAAATAALSVRSELLTLVPIRARLAQSSSPHLAKIESIELIVRAPIGAAHADDAHGVKLLQKRRRLEVLDDEKPPVHPRSKTSAGHVASIQRASMSQLADLIHREVRGNPVSAPDLVSWQSGNASPSSHSWENLQFSPFLQEPGLAL